MESLYLEQTDVDRRGNRVHAMHNITPKHLYVLDTALWDLEVKIKSSLSRCSKEYLPLITEIRNGIKNL